MMGGCYISDSCELFVGGKRPDSGRLKHNVVVFLLTQQRSVEFINTPVSFHLAKKEIASLALLFCRLTTQESSSSWFHIKRSLFTPCELWLWKTWWKICHIFCNMPPWGRLSFQIFYWFFRDGMWPSTAAAKHSFHTGEEKKTDT